MIELELDGKRVSAKPGSTILEVALNQGKYIPHFCYHKKLSIAANCRMCLVEVEKAPKPLPACATPITEGMKVSTCSKIAADAQKGVMEFLLINHPLDCPICDQGGECQLQDLAVGYGRSETRFQEEKRSVTNKDLGSLVSTEMTRCIHCSRCVRFTDEIAGFQELGMSYRNNHVEVMPFIGKTVNSELSGNIIDICPVGALTSKPFRNQYRSWELSRRKSIAPHDGLGSNIIAQVDKYHKVVRVLPLENEQINECWLSDRDRFSYEGLYHEERITEPMIKQDGKWIKTTWDIAIAYAAKSIDGIKADHGAEQIGVLASPSSTTEELFLLQKLMRGLGVNNIDHRLSQTDFSLDGKSTGTLSLGSAIGDFTSSKSVLLIGGILREEQPLIASKLRSAVKQGLELNVINVLQEDLLCNLKTQIVVDPRSILYTLAQVAKASGTKEFDFADVEVTDKARSIYASLEQGGHIVLGAISRSLPNYNQIVTLGYKLAKHLNAKFGEFATYANQVGADLVGFVPYKGAFSQPVSKLGLNAKDMLEKRLKSYVLLNTELEHDSYNAQMALDALNQAATVVVMSPFFSKMMATYADVILPISPFTETAGSYVNMSGSWQKFNGVTRPLGDAKPAWKVLRVIANSLQVKGFDYNSIEDVRTELEDLQEVSKFLEYSVEHNVVITKPVLDNMIRFGIQGIYNLDSITRRANSLQQTALAKLPTLASNQKVLDKVGATNGADVLVTQGDYTQELKISLSNDLPDTVILLAANAMTNNFAGRFDEISILHKSDFK